MEEIKKKILAKQKRKWPEVYGILYAAKQLQLNNIKICWGLKQFEILNEKNIVIGERGYFDRNNYFTINIQGTMSRNKFMINNYDKTNWRKFNIDLFEHKHGDCILFCSQPPNDSVLPISEKYFYWINNTITKLLKYNKKVIFREHPSDKTNVVLLNLNSLVKNHHNFFISRDKLENDFKKSYVTIGYNSSCLVDSLIHGVPIIGFDDLSVVYEFSNNMSDILNNSISYPDITSLENKCCLLANNQFPNKDPLSDDLIQKIKSILNKNSKNKD